MQIKLYHLFRTFNITTNVDTPKKEESSVLSPSILIPAARTSESAISAPSDLARTSTENTALLGASTVSPNYSRVDEHHDNEHRAILTRIQSHNVAGSEFGTSEDFGGFQSLWDIMTPSEKFVYVHSFQVTRL